MDAYLHGYDEPAMRMKRWSVGGWRQPHELFWVKAGIVAKVVATFCGVDLSQAIVSRRSPDSDLEGIPEWWWQ